MVYRRWHECDKAECKTLTAYIRVDGKWTRIGHYGSLCNMFEPLDLEQEEEDRQRKQRLKEIQDMVRKASFQE